MSTSTAIAVSALAISASNSSSQRKELCKLTIDQFDNKTASIEQKQNYADCVYKIHPQTMSDPAIILVKILIVCVRLSALGLELGKQGMKVELLIILCSE